MTRWKVFLVISALAVAALLTLLGTAHRRINELDRILEDPNGYWSYVAERAAEQFEREPAQTIFHDGVPLKGPTEAPIKIVVFSDFLCPDCRNFAHALDAYLPQSGGRVAVLFKNYPLDSTCNPDLSTPLHVGACNLALASMCAFQQGKFWAYHDRLFSQTTLPSPTDAAVVIATQAGLSTDAFVQCLQSTATKERLARDIEEARRLHVRETPAVFINGRRLRHSAMIITVIERESARLGLTAKQPSGSHP